MLLWVLPAVHSASWLLKWTQYHSNVTSIWMDMKFSSKTNRCAHNPSVLNGSIYSWYGNYGLFMVLIFRCKLCVSLSNTSNTETKGGSGAASKGQVPCFLTGEREFFCHIFFFFFFLINHVWRPENGLALQCNFIVNQQFQNFKKTKPPYKRQGLALKNIKTSVSPCWLRDQR